MPTAADCRVIHLGVTTQTKIVVAGHKHLVIDRAVYLVAGTAPFAHGLMLHYKRAALIPVTFETGLIHTCRRRTCSRFNVHPMRVVTIRTAHLPFQNRMVVGKSKFKFLLGMARKTSRRVFLRVNDVNSTPSAGIHVKAPGPMAHFAFQDQC